MPIRDEKTGKFISTQDQLTESQKLEKQLQELQAQLAEAKAKEQAEAEKAVADKKAEAAAERKAFVDEIQAAANTYLKQVAENKKVKEELANKEAEAYNIYKAKLDEFSDKFNGYHLTYKIDGDNVEFKIEEARANSFEEIRKEQLKQIRDFWNNWFNF